MRSFIIEGVLTVLIGIVGYVFLVDVSIFVVDIQGTLDDTLFSSQTEPSSRNIGASSKTMR